MAEYFKKIKVGGTIFAVGEAADFVNVGMGGMYGIITCISIFGSFLYIYADGSKGIKVRLEDGDVPEGEAPEPISTKRRE